MTGAIVSFEVEGVKHSLYFGMVATKIITLKSGTLSGQEDVDDLTPFAYIVFGGLCNNADLNDVQRPEFKQAYMLTESIAGNDELTTMIYSAWTESKPYKELTEKLQVGKKKVNQKQKTGTK